MTKEQINKIIDLNSQGISYRKIAKFTGGMTAIYKGNIYEIAQVDFEEKLVGLLMNIQGAEPDEVSWVRCENVTICN